jgi:DNA-binding NtrC family response regulator
VGVGPAARTQSVGKGPLLVGSGLDNDIVIADATVSRHHCRLDPSPMGVAVRDLESRNGTWVDGVAVRVGRALPGSRIRLGRTQLVVLGVPPPPEGSLLAQSAAMRAVLAQVARFARVPLPALVLGETGVGKEGVARALHDRGAEPGGPFVAVNAGSLTRDLAESELFGHERGAFTGAVATKRGVFEQADGGTLFLDEVGELPLDLQARLLRVLETWQVQRVGSERPLPVRVRLVCATHRDLRAMVEGGAFRADLYFRVARLRIEVPPLRARLDDLAPLAVHFLERLAAHVGPKSLSEGALAKLMLHDWPGNVRELRNVVELAALSTSGPVIDVGDVELEHCVAKGRPSPRPSAAALQQVIDAHRGNLSAAARTLMMPRSTLKDRVNRQRG